MFPGQIFCCGIRETVAERRGGDGGFKIGTCVIMHTCNIEFQKGEVRYPSCHGRSIVNC